MGLQERRGEGSISDLHLEKVRAPNKPDRGFKVAFHYSSWQLRALIIRMGLPRYELTQGLLR